MQEFHYLIEKIENSKIDDYPFKHLYIENFLSDDHFKKIVSTPFVNIPKAENTKALISYLLEIGYINIKFPGCKTDIDSYIRDYEEGFNNKESKIVETYGLAFKLLKGKTKWHGDYVKALIKFLNSDEFHKCLRNKFSLKETTKINTAIQKYLSGYEISPHPDNRDKALTYLVNINPSEISEQIDIHTHLLAFKSQYEYVRNFWRDNLNEERLWLPWSWCESNKVINKNNSLIMFSPSDDTLHGVKLNYDHCLFQRTQLYGNLWYESKNKYNNTPYDKIPNINK